MQKPQLSRAQVESFQEIYERITGEALSFEEAVKAATDLLGFYYLVHDPLFSIHAEEH